MSETPNLESPEGYSADVIANAVRFTVSLFLGRGKFDNREATDAAEAARLAEAMLAEHPKTTRKPLITAFDAAGNSALVGVPEEKKARVPTKKPKRPATKKGARRPKIAPAAPAAAKLAPPAGHYGERWTKEAAALWEASAAKGKLPPVPDFESAPTHAPYRKTLARLVEAASKGDLAALRAVEIRPISSSRVIMHRWQSYAIKALEARGERSAKRKAKAQARPALADAERPS